MTILTLVLQVFAELPCPPYCGLQARDEVRVLTDAINTLTALRDRLEVITGTGASG